MGFPDTTPRYSLLDYGDGRKLEIFGGILLDRPAPQAAGPRRFPRYWEQAHARYHRNSGWERLLPFSEPWQTSIGGIIFELRLSAGGQVGVFPEQRTNWQWIRNAILYARRDLTILNGFAYTGGSTLAAITTSTPYRVEVCHLDGAKGAVAWARRNVLLNGKDQAPVRWIVDDTLTFLRREARRGRRYDGIILDPPAFGLGPQGKRWKLGNDLPTLLDAATAILSEHPLFLLLSWHDPALSVETAIRETTDRVRAFSSAEKAQLVLPGESTPPLTAGSAVRFLR